MAIIFILFFILNGNKFYTIKEKDIESKNKLSLEKEKINNYSLKLKEDINYNKLYVYELKNDEFYVFIYSKSIFFDRYNLDDDFMTSIISSAFSSPTESLIKPSEMPAAALSSAV